MMNEKDIMLSGELYNAADPGFLDAGKKCIATIYTDADNTDWKNTPEAYQIEKFTVTGASVLK